MGAGNDDAERADRADGGAEEVVPAGRGGADSGAADLVGVEGTAPRAPDAGEQNDIPGVGPARRGKPGEEDPAAGEDGGGAPTGRDAAPAAEAEREAHE